MRPGDGGALTALRLVPLAPAHREPLAQLVAATGAFTADEVAVAVELIDTGLVTGDASGYYFVVAERAGRAVGYTCFGPTPLTNGVHDLYWIAVSPTEQGKGTGKALLAAAETEVRRRGGRKIIIETAGKPAYAATRGFYERCAYVLEARIADYYARGDDKLFYTRSI